MPIRIQRKRTKGWKLPEGAVCVTRPGKWGNPFKVSDCLEYGHAIDKLDAARICVEAYRAWMKGEKHWAHGIPMRSRPDITELRGKDLACWCAIGDPCHADVQLELANGGGLNDGKWNEDHR